jgi:NADH:ubiquinone oxidoreductase subunit
LSEYKQIQAWPNGAHVDICPERHDMILQLRTAAGALNLIARFAEQCNIVAALFTSNWQTQNQVFGRATDFERVLIGLRWILPASHRDLSKIQNHSVGWLHRMMNPHPQPSRHSENWNRGHGNPSLRATPLARGFLTQLREFLIAQAAGAEVIQPLVDLCEYPGVGSYYFNERYADG